MISKNHCDDLAKKRRFCYLDMTKSVFFRLILLIFIKVCVSKNMNIFKKCHVFILFSDILFQRDRRAKMLYLQLFYSYNVSYKFQGESMFSGKIPYTIFCLFVDKTVYS